MKITNNQYLKLEVSLEEIAKIEIDIDMRINKNIEDIDIEIDNLEPNIMICYINEENKEIDFNNIYPSVRTIIINYEGLDGRWNIIPDYIENIIVDNRIYKNNRNKFDFIEFNKRTERIRILTELIEENKINEFNIVGESLLNWLCDDEQDELEYKTLKVIENISNYEIFNSYNKRKETSLFCACYNEKIEIAERLIEKMDKEYINMSSKTNETALMYACCNRMESVANKLIEKMDISAINKINKENMTALIFACQYNLSSIALKLIDIMDIKSINIISHYGWCTYPETSLFWACKNNMSSIALKLIEKMDKKNIDIECDENTRAIDVAIKNNMLKVASAIYRKN